MNQEKYIGMDVHDATISAAVKNAQGKLLMECVLETKAATILEFIQGLRGTLALTFEEGILAAWLHDLLKPHVSRLVVCDPRKNALRRDGNQNDRADARNLAELLRTNQVKTVYHGKHGIRTLRELGRSYLAHTKDSTRVMNRIKSVYRSWAIPGAGTSVYSRRRRAEWLAKLVEPGVRIRAEHLYEQLDSLEPVRPSSPMRAVTGKSQAWGGEPASPDSCNWSDSLRPAGGLTADTPSLPYQAPALGLRRFCRPDL
jgi:transposase